MGLAQKLSSFEQAKVKHSFNEFESIIMLLKLSKQLFKILV